MKLPENHPRIIRDLAEHGYIAKSGNTARFELAFEGQDRTRGTRVGYVVHWTRKPSEADKAELEQIAAGNGSVIKRAPDLTTAGPAAVAAAAKRFLEGE